MRSRTISRSGHRRLAPMAAAALALVVTAVAVAGSTPSLLPYPKSVTRPMTAPLFGVPQPPEVRIPPYVELRFFALLGSYQSDGLRLGYSFPAWMRLHGIGAREQQLMMILYARYGTTSNPWRAGLGSPASAAGPIGIGSASYAGHSRR